MKHKFLILTIAILTLLVLTRSALAADPLGTAFTYQGQLKNSGSAFTGSCDMQFGLYDAQAAGTLIGATQTLNGVTVTAGFFTVRLDFGTGVFAGDDRYLEIAVKCGSDASYTTLAPRQELTAVPYALYALNTPGSGTGWALTGNASTNSATNFVGTTDDQGLVLRVNNTVGWQLSPSGTNTPNVIGGYSGNSVTAGVKGAAIGGGGASSNTNRVTDDYGTVGGGSNNRAGDNGGSTSDTAFATVAGGQNNTARNEGSTVGGGNNNTASGLLSTLGGGNNNTASGAVSTVVGGNSNTASGTLSTVGGGGNNVAAGDFSFVAGYFAKNTNPAHDAVFLFADFTFGTDFNSVAANEFAARATGGVRFVTDSAGTTGCSIAAGGGAWNCTSDRNAKTNFANVSPRDILDKVMQLPIQSWQFKTEANNVRHIGPMAQDFRAAFGLGIDDKTIAGVDADGISLAAIQGLYELVQQKEKRIGALEQENAELKAHLDENDARLTALESAQNGTTPLVTLMPLFVIALGAGVWIGRKRGAKR